MALLAMRSTLSSMGCGGADYLQCVIDLGGWCVVVGVSYRQLATPKSDSFLVLNCTNILHKVHQLN